MFNTRIPLYGVTLIFAIISGLIVIYKNAKIINYKKEEKMALLIYIILGAIFGGKYFTFFVNFDKYKGNFDFLNTGLSSYGAVIGILIMLYIFAKQFKKSYKQVISVLLPSIPLMYGIGKIGCFLAGCCYGIYYSGAFKVVYNYSLVAPKGISLFPIQILETIIFILIFIYLFNKRLFETNENKNIGETFILCSIAKFLLDYLRYSHINKIISINQIVSIIFFIIGILLLLKENIQSKKRL